MMARKRKANPHARNIQHTLKRKRQKNSYTVLSSSETEESTDQNSDIGEDEWLIRCILDEDETQYLIDWEGSWSPTWEPKDNANDIAVRVWEEKKRSAGAQKVHQSIEGAQPQQPPPILAGDTHLSPQSESPCLEIDLYSTPEDRTDRPSNTEAGPQVSVGRIKALEFAIARDANREFKPHSPPNRQFSFLFVTPEPESGLQLVRNESGPIEEIPETRLEDSKPPESVRTADRNGSQCGQTFFKLEDTYGTSLFKYIPLPPIPREYRLPGETGARSERGSRCSSISAYAGALKPSGSTASDTTDEIKYYDSLELQDHLSPETSQEGKSVDEIAETPSATFTEDKINHPQPGTEEVSLSSYCAVEIGQDSVIDPIKCTSFTETFSSFSTGVITVGHNNPVTIRSSKLQTSEKPDYQSQNTEQAAVQSSDPMLKGEIDKENRRKPLSYAEVMEKYSHVPGSTPSEKMRNVYAEIREKSFEVENHLRASARPSEPPILATSAELTHSQTGEVDKGHDSHSTLLPVSGSLLHQQEVLYPKHEENTMQTIQPSALTVHYTQPPRGSVQLGPSEFALTLPMDSRLKDDYERVLRREARSIRDFMAMSSVVSTDNAFENEYQHLESKMNNILEQLGNITTHPDLNMIEHIRYSQSDLEQEASWGEYSSSKFLLLGYLVQVASGRDLHFVVMVQGHKLLDIFERFLLGKGLAYTRPRQEMGPGTELEISMVKDSLSFGIQTTRSDGIVQTYKPPSMVIALDRSFNAQTPSVEHMRTTYARNGHLLPVIRLLISNTSEHIERCLPDVFPPQRLRLLIHHTMELLGVVGELQDNAFNVHEDVEEVLSCLASDNFDANWSLPPIEPLQIAEPEELDAILHESQRDVTLGRSLNLEPTTQKRSIQAEDAIEQALKRPRTESKPADVDFAAGRLNTLSQTLDGDLEIAETKPAQMMPANSAELDKLQRALVDTDSRLTQRVKIHEELQHRYESRSKDLHKIRRERDSFGAAKLALEERVGRQRDEMTKLKDERTELKRDLQQAREAIRNGGGSAAELEAANEEIRRLKADNAGLERKADYEKNQAEYTREQYQTASTVAAQSGNEIRQLKAENEMLKRKVAGEASRLREVNLNSDQTTHLSRVTELELTLANRDDLLRRKEEELREIRKNRPSTRSTSTQPRSPKISSANSRPSSPGLNNNHNGSNPLGRGSSALRFSSEMR